MGNIDRGEIAVAGSSSNPDDPSNDPKGASAWGHDRDIRASLIDCLSADRDAIGMEDVGGIRILGSRIVQELDPNNAEALTVLDGQVRVRLRLGMAMSPSSKINDSRRTQVVVIAVDSAD